jgi:hypothetical protein
MITFTAPRWVVVVLVIVIATTTVGNYSEARDGLHALINDITNLAR